MSEPSDNSPITQILTDLRSRGDEAFDVLFPLVYDELRKIAGGYFSRERSDHTLQPTALVHEAYLKLFDGATQVKDRVHFLAVASRATPSLPQYGQTGFCAAAGQGD